MPYKVITKHETNIANVMSASSNYEHYWWISTMKTRKEAEELLKSREEADSVVDGWIEEISANPMS